MYNVKFKETSSVQTQVKCKRACSSAHYTAACTFPNCYLNIFFQQQKRTQYITNTALVRFVTSKSVDFCKLTFNFPLRKRQSFTTSRLRVLTTKHSCIIGCDCAFEASKATLHTTMTNRVHQPFLYTYIEYAL
ncbi:hypothetical protein Tsp_13508 [Trichinella spiralis]|uniref:hypothetical protein n=1 Tax=Trichinella spiralis TaxID=6334 RepID=UPI0001EFED85|nr:hypothetical protein Tsp_13508 [Trichinella spiralis]